MRLVAVIAAIIFLELIMETLQLHRYQQGSSMAHLKAGAELIHVSNSSLKDTGSMLHKSRTSKQFDEPTTSRFLWESRKAIDRQDFQNPVKHLNLLQYLQSIINAKDNAADDSSLMTNSYHPTTLSRSSPYAYAFLLVGCNPANPSYLGFLFNILVSAQILREQGSQAEQAVIQSPCFLAGFRPPNRALKEMFDSGYSLVCGSVDLGLLRDAARADVEQANQCF